MVGRKTTIKKILQKSMKHLGGRLVHFFATRATSIDFERNQLFSFFVAGWRHWREFYLPEFGLCSELGTKFC